MKNLIIDVSPMIYASYFTLHEKLSWWMVHGVLNSILNVVNEEQADSLVLCWGSKKNKKYEIFPQYRAKRTVKIKFDEKQSDQLINLFSSLQVPQLRMPGVEADQLIAASANQLDECMIISEDKDFFQLLTKTKVLKGKRRGLWDENTVCMKYGVKEAHLFADVQALIGDNADNIPRITSMKKAVDVVNLKGRLDTWLLKPEPDVSNVPHLLAKKLLEEKKQIEINYQLVDLRQEQLKPEYFLPKQLNLDFVKDKLLKMNMRGFVKRFDEFERIANFHGPS